MGVRLVELVGLVVVVVTVLVPLVEVVVGLVDVMIVLVVVGPVKVMVVLVVVVVTPVLFPTAKFVPPREVTRTVPQMECPATLTSDGMTQAWPFQYSSPVAEVTEGLVMHILAVIPEVIVPFPTTNTS